MSIDMRKLQRGNWVGGLGPGAGTCVNSRKVCISVQCFLKLAGSLGWLWW